VDKPEAGSLVSNDMPVVVEPHEKTSQGSTVAASVLPIK